MNVRLRGVRRRQLDTPPPIWERSIVVNVSCVFIRKHVLETTLPIFNFLHSTYGRALVLLWRRSDTSCTSGFMDDVISRGSSTSLSS